MAPDIEKRPGVGSGQEVEVRGQGGDEKVIKALRIFAKNSARHAFAATLPRPPTYTQTSRRRDDLPDPVGLFVAARPLP